MNESNTCRIPPPSALRYFRAYVINSLLPANTEPIGAAKPFDKHTLNNDIHWPAIDIVVWYGMVWYGMIIRVYLTESACSTNAFMDIPSATAALGNRAPSICNFKLLARANAATLLVYSTDSTRPPLLYHSKA
jgi:hypothetical protein